MQQDASERRVSPLAPLQVDGNPGQEGLSVGLAVERAGRADSRRIAIASLPSSAAIDPGAGRLRCLVKRSTAAP
jgi:hypothetical protein